MHNGCDQSVIGRKIPSDAALKRMPKWELIAYLRIAQHNYSTLMEFYDNAVKTNEELLKGQQKILGKIGDKVYHVIHDECSKPKDYISVNTIKDSGINAIYFADDWWTKEEMQKLNVFLSKEAAEEKLKELRGENKRD